MYLILGLVGDGIEEPKVQFCMIGGKEVPDAIDWSVPLTVGQHENTGDILTLGKDHTLDLHGGQFESGSPLNITLKSVFNVTRMDGTTAQHTLAPKQQYTDYGRHVAVLVIRDRASFSDNVIGRVMVRGL